MSGNFNNNVCYSPRRGSQNGVALLDAVKLFDLFGILIFIGCLVVPALTVVGIVGLAYVREHYILFSVAFTVWLFVESLFFMQRLRQRRLFEKEPEPETDVDGTDIIKWTLAACSREQLEGWFYGAALEDVHYENFEEFLAWAFFNAKVERLSKKQRQDIDKAITMVQKHWNIKVKPGRNPSVLSMRHTLEPIRAGHHPFLLYLWCMAAAWLHGVYFRLAGFRRHRAGALHYWHRPACSPGGAGKPAGVFLHGIGIGLLPYTTFIRKLGSDGRALVLVELPHVSLRLCDHVPSMRAMAASVAAAMDATGHQTASLVGHSYGTGVLARFCKDYPSRVHTCTFVDPVCFLLCAPDVAHNFVYRKPKHKYEYLRYYLLSRELQTSWVLCRNFVWHKMALWPHEIQAERTVVVLAGSDEIVPSSEVREYLRRHVPSLPVLWLPGPHAGFAASCPFQHRILDAIRKVEAANAKV
eukprot:Colp12_sorted_trinity150504_noHs@6319